MYSTFFSSVAGPTYCKLLDLSIHNTLQPEFVLPMSDSTKFWPSSIFHDEDPVMRIITSVIIFRNIALWFLFPTNYWLDNELKFQCSLNYMNINFLWCIIDQIFNKLWIYKKWRFQKINFLFISIWFWNFLQNYQIFKWILRSGSPLVNP